jgi:hypothetical protein
MHRSERGKITELSRNENYDALPTLGRIQRIAAQTD